MRKDQFIHAIKKYMNQYNYKVVNKSDEEKAVDVVISKQIILHLNEFFDNKMIDKVRKHKTIKKRRFIILRNKLERKVLKLDELNIVLFPVYK